MRLFLSLALSKQAYSRLFLSSTASTSNISCRCYHSVVSKLDDISMKNEAHWYNMPLDDVKTLFPQFYLTPTYRKQIDTFQECKTMIRQPLIDIVNCMRSIVTPVRPLTRFVLYGKHGCGKSLTLTQLVHHAHVNGWVICHSPYVIWWNRLYKEVAMSSYKSGRIDLPLEAAEWLGYFKTVNGDLIKNAGLTTTKKYQWSKREETECGVPLMDIVEMGLNRIRFASDCVGAMVRELKIAASHDKIKVLVTIDSVNTLFQETRIKREDGKFAHADTVTLNCALKKLLLSDWTNSIAVTTVDVRARGLLSYSSHLPMNLLGENGFDFMDPFIPVKVDLYSEKEAQSLLDYYTDMNWLQHPNGKTVAGREQMMHLAAFNPSTLERICAAW